MHHPPPALSTAGLTRSFGSFYAVQNVDLSVPQGAIFGLLGPNGAGKSTALRLLAGLLRPTRGEIWRAGQRTHPHRPKARKGLGALIDEPGLWPALSGRQHLDGLGRLGGTRDHDWRDRLIDNLGLGLAIDRKVGTWSFGMRQRLGIALALYPKPKLLILDEPTNGLDPRGIRTVRSLVQEVAATENMTVLLSSHLLLEMDKLCTHIGILNRGQLCLQGSLTDLLAAEVRLRLRASPMSGAHAFLKEHCGQNLVSTAADDFLIQVGEDSEAEARAISRALGSAGFAISHLSAERPRLEDLFLSATEAEPC